MKRVSAYAFVEWLKHIHEKTFKNLAPIAIRILSRADYAPVEHGSWISLTDCSNAGVYCSNCHKKVYKEDYAWCNRKNKLRSPYCPNCGAKKDGPEICV